MNFSKIFQLGCLSALLNISLFACHDAHSTEDWHFHIDKSCQEHFGTATFSAGPDLWYSIETNSYPEVVALSQSRNRGLSEGGVYLSPTGFTIGEAGNYWAHITAILQNPIENSTILIPVYLVVDESFDPNEPSPIGGVITLKSGDIATVQGAGILKNVVPGTRLSVVASNAGYPLPVPVTVVSWSISLHKLP